MGCTVTVSGLHAETKEEDVRQRFHDIELEPLKVTLPRESRRQKSCGTSFVMLKSSAEAQAAVHQLNGTLIHEQPITVSFLMTENPERKPAPRVKWAKDSELWEAGEHLLRASKEIHSILYNKARKRALLKAFGCFSRFFEVVRAVLPGHCLRTGRDGGATGPAREESGAFP